MQDFGTSETNHHLHGAPVYWAGQNGAQIYVWRENQRLSAYPFVNGKIVPTPKLGVDALPEGMPGGMLSLSSSGKTNGILWAVTPRSFSFLQTPLWRSLGKLVSQLPSLVPR